MVDKQAYLGFSLVLLLILVLSIVSALLLDPSMTKAFLAENGPVETASALGYLLCMLYMFYRGGREYFRRFHYIILMVTVFMLRELDFDKRFTAVGVFKSKFLVSDMVSPIEKFFGGLVLLLVVYILFSLLIRDGLSWLKGLLKLDAVAVGVFLTLSLLVAAKTLDGLGRKLQEFGITLSESASVFALTGEEVFELGIPLMILVTFVAYMRQREGKLNSPASVAAESG